MFFSFSYLYFRLSCCNPNNKRMTGSTDFWKLHDLCQSGGSSKGLSIVQLCLCLMNDIVCSHYERWYKNRHNAKVIPRTAVILRNVFGYWSTSWHVFTSFTVMTIMTEVERVPSLSFWMSLWVTFRPTFIRFTVYSRYWTRITSVLCVGCTFV